MRFYISSAFLNTREIVEVAKAADDLGYDGIGIPDHVINLETLATPYPYAKDGQRRWQPFTDWPDPWVLIGALAQVTTRLQFVTTVYIPAMRNPYSAAKAIGTAAFLAAGRVELGVGVGWCAEEFALMGEQFEVRGRRTDEMLDLMRALWEPGWTEFDGEFYHLTPLTDALTVADYQRAADAGITGILTMPWMFYAGPNATLTERVDGMRPFRKDLALDR